MKKMIFILLLISPALFGQTYYISPSGNDVTGDGSSGSPWRSLYRATSEVTTAGSTIFVREGTYTETSQSQLAAQVNIEGTGAGSIITSTTLTDKPIIRASSAIEGGIGNQTISNLYFDGADTTAFSAIYVVARSNVTIHHCTFVNFLRNGVIFAGRITSSSQFPPDVYSENNKFHHNIMLNCSHDRAGVWSIYLASGALTISGQKDMIVEYNIIDNTTSTRNGYGINTLPPSMGYGNNMGLKIRNNTIKVNKAYRTGSITQWDFAIELWTNKGGIEITNNEISGGVDLAGFGTDDTGGYGFAAKILNNNITWDTPSSHETVAIILESGLLGGITIMGNYIKNYSTGIAFNQLPTNPPIPGNHIAEDVLIAYNVFDDIKRADAEDSYLTEFLNLEEKAYYTNIYFQNNTVFGTTSNGGTMNGFFAWNSVASEIKKEFTNLRVENNIFSGYRRPISIQNQIIDGITVRNNISYNNTYDAYSFAGSDIINDNIENAIATNPLFVDAGAANFQLQSGSPAINAGIDVGLGKDFRGWSIVGLPDIGAYEYGATAPAVGGMLIDASGVLLRSDGGALLKIE